MELKVGKIHSKSGLQNYKMVNRKFSKQSNERKNKNEKYRKEQQRHMGISKCLILIKLHPRGEDKILKDTVYLKRDVFKKQWLFFS